jgi:hypothetical protein
MASVVMYSGSAERRPSTRPFFFGKAENLILNAGQIILKGGPFFPLYYPPAPCDYSSPPHTGKDNTTAGDYGRTL